MTKLEIPIIGKTLWNTGDVRLWAELELLLKDASGVFKQANFRIDTGTEITTMSAFEAHGLDLPIPRQASPGAYHTQTGLEIRSGLLRFQIDGMDQTEYVTACLFLGDPHNPLNPNLPGSTPRNLLQPFGLLQQLRFSMDFDMSWGAPYGMLFVEKK